MRPIPKQLSSSFKPLKNLAISPLVMILMTTLLAALYALSEWIFIFTRPSFLKTVPLVEKLEALGATSSLLILACILLVFVILVPCLIFRNQGVRRYFTAIALLIPTLLFTSTVLLLVDNFTYTIFRFGIVSTTGAWRGIYAFLIVLLAVYLYTRLADLGNLLTAFFSRQKPQTRTIVPLVIISLVVLGAVLPANLSLEKSAAMKQRTASSRNQLPDILLITVDAVNAEYTSIGNSERDTTPFLREMAAHSLVGMNHFANAQGTIGSLTSLLTGRHPADVRVIYSSDMLQATDAYQHLPGILNSLGYYTVQLSNAQYADAYKTNFQSAFDLANGRSTTDQPVNNALNRLYPGITAIFQNEVIERISARVLHLVYIRDMNNPYREVTEAPKKFDDLEKIEEVKSLLEERREPLFIHVHWMGTHGPNYYPDEQVFSSGIDINDQEKDRQLFYYDSVLEFDRTIADLYQFLEETNRLDNTILIITSDHSQKWTNSRLPLVIDIPGDTEAKKISVNTENIDIAPTLLDYLDIPQPAWMPGQSLLSGANNAHPIFTAKIPRSSRDSVTGKVVYPESKAPFFQFGRISVVECDQWFELDLTEKTLKSGVVVDHSGACPLETDSRSAISLIIQHLQQYGFDASSLQVLLKNDW